MFYLSENPEYLGSHATPTLIAN